MKCHFCNRRAVGGPCRWPVDVFESATYAELAVNDVVRRSSKKLDKRPPATVWAIGPVKTVQGMLSVTLAIRGRLKSIVVLSKSTVRVLRKAYCNVDTCERHQRELAAAKIVCQDHWNAWEQIA